MLRIIGFSSSIASLVGPGWTRRAQGFAAPHVACAGASSIQSSHLGVRMAQRRVESACEGGGEQVHMHHTHGWADSDLHSVPKPRRDLEHMVNWRPFARWPAPWYAENVYFIADDQVKSQNRCRTSVSSAAEYGIPFSEDSWEILHMDGGDVGISLQDGKSFALKPCLSVLGVALDKDGGAPTAISARAEVATGVWFRHRKWLCCRRAPLHLRLEHLWASAGASFSYGVGGRKLSTELGGTCLRMLSRKIVARLGPGRHPCG